MLLLTLIVSVAGRSNSAHFRDNPNDYYRDPCPESRPDTKCNAFDEYVWRRDNNYKWEIVETYTEYDGVTGYAILLHSQQWLDSSVYYIEREGPGATVWSHWVNVWIPSGRTLDSDLLDSAILFVDGGKNSAGPPSLNDKYVKLGRLLCSITGLVYVNIKQIPNEKLVFHNDWKSSRTEDGIIALTWRHFLDYPDQPEWLLRFPMVKACLRAMDMTSELSVQLGGIPLTRWSVLGGSKRGWTSWMVAVADPERVVVVAPIVLDLLNMRENLHHMWRNTGNWSFTFSDYWMEELLGRLDEDNFQLMAEYIDPFEYKERLTMPKLIISSCGDEFFMPDDSHYFFDELPEPKYMRLLPNAEHSTVISGLSAPHFMFSFRQFVLATLKGYPLPKMTWKRWDDPLTKRGGIELITDTPVKQIYGWVGDTRTRFRRDFRLAGVRNNHKGNTLKPDYPELPDGYPDKAASPSNRSSYDGLLYNMSLTLV